MSIFVASFTTGCELTSEYQDLREKIVQESRRNYEECINSVSNFNYWKSYTACINDELEKSVGGGCAHIAGFRYTEGKYMKDETKHCDILKPSRGQIGKMLKQRVEQLKIKKCK